MRKYDVSAIVTISLRAQVTARDEAHAIEMAEDLGMCAIHESTYNPDIGDGDWHTSGELDGSAVEISARAT